MAALAVLAGVTVYVCLSLDDSILALVIVISGGVQGA